MVLWLAWFSALSCLLGAAELIAWRGGNRILPPLDILRFTPFHDYLVPGVILGLVVGGAQLFCLVGTYRRMGIAPLA